MAKFHTYSEARGIKWGTFWWVAAAGLHAAAIFCLIYLTPLRDWFFAKPKLEQAFKGLEGTKVQRVAEEMIEINTRRIAEKVEKQKAALGKLAGMCETRHARYASEARKAGRPAEALDVLGPPGPDPNISLYDKSIVELYDAAQAIERTTFGTYRRLRAVELARIQALPIEEAFEATTVALPTHPPIDESVLHQRITNVTDGRLDALKAELFKIRAEVGSMLAAVLRMIDMAEGIMGEDIGRTVISGSGGVFEGAGGGRWGSGIGPTLAPHEFYPGNRDGDFDETFRPIAGRKLMDTGRQAEWMYIDTWYMIGPFPNPNRAYMDKKFPPESAIDLDATYVGKDGMKLQWQWRQSARMMIAPHHATNYAVWYAYTEIYADAEQDRYVAFGSDDYSKVWLNGELKWTSGKTPHKWIPDRGFRKLHFKKGYNSMLLKLENAGGTTGFSVVVYLGDAEF